MFSEAIKVTASTEISHPALWLDPKSAVGPNEREQLAAAGLQLLHPTTGKPLHLRSRCFGDGLVGEDPLN